MSRLLIELDNIDRLNAEQIKDAIKKTGEMIQQSWERDQAMQRAESPEMEDVAMGLDADQNIVEVPIMPARKGECGCAKCTMRRLMTQPAPGEGMVH